MMKRVIGLRPILIGLAGGVIAAAAWIAVHQYAVRAAVQRARPATPDLAGWPTELRDRIRDEQARAGGIVSSCAALGELGQLFHANGFFDEAMRCYTALVELEPADARWPHLLASILSTFGRLDEAAPLFERAAKLQPEHIASSLRSADVRLKANLTDEANDIYADVQKRTGGNVYALLGLARCAIAAGDWDAARDILGRAIRTNEDFVGALSLLVAVHEHFGERSEADRLREKIGRREFVDLPDPWIDALADSYCYDAYRLSVASAMARQAGDFPRSIRLLERATALSPNAASYRRQLGLVHHARRDFSPARDHFQAALRIDPLDTDSWAFLVNSFEQMGEPLAAGQALAAGLAACPESAALHLAYGRRLRESGRYAESIAELQESKRLRPNEANAYLELARVYFILTRVDEGVAELRATLAILPGQPLALGILASNAIHSGDEKEARQWIREMKQQPRIPAEDMRAVESQFVQQFGGPAP